MWFGHNGPIRKGELRDKVPPIADEGNLVEEGHVSIPILGPSHVTLGLPLEA